MNTHPTLFTKEDSLGAIATKKVNAPSRSVLGDIGNTPPRGICTNGGSTNKDKYKVTWAGVVSRGTLPKE